MAILVWASPACTSKFKIHSHFLPFFTLNSHNAIPAFCYYLVPPEEDPMPIDVRGLAPLLQVFDMPTAVHFYRDILGFELVSTSRPGEHFDWALLSLNGTELMLNTAYESDQRPSAPDPARVAAHDDTALYFGCEDLDAAYRHLCANG